MKPLIFKTRSRKATAVLYVDPVYEAYYRDLFLNRLKWEESK